MIPLNFDQIVIENHCDNSIINQDNQFVSIMSYTSNQKIIFIVAVTPMMLLIAAR